MNLQLMEKKLENLKAEGVQGEARVRHCQTIVHNMAIAYLIWARFFFLAIPRSSLTCNHSWVTFALCSLSTLFYSVFFVDALLMLHRTEDKHALILQNKAELHHKISMARELEASAMEAGEGVVEVEVEVEMEMEMEMAKNSNDGWRRKVYIYTILSTFVGLAATELYASKFLLCD